MHAATGGVGLATLALAAARSCELWATAGSPAKRSRLRALFGSRVCCLSSRSLAFVEELPCGIDAVLNSLTSPGFTAASLAVLRPGGALVEIGKRDILSAARAGQDAPHVTMHTVAIDFLPPKARVAGWLKAGGVLGGTRRDFGGWFCWRAHALRGRAGA